MTSGLDVFTFFPDSNLIESSHLYHATGFLGHTDLEAVYTAGYRMGEDSVLLFVTKDRAGTKYLELVAFASQQSQVTLAPGEILFDEHYSLVFNHPAHKQVLTGLKGGWLVGVL